MRRMAWLVPVVLTACGNSTPSNPGGPIGSACAVPADCADECLPPSDTYPGGVCSMWCGDGGSCPIGTRCVTIGTDAFCLADCASGSDCREGWGCGAAGACVPCSLEPTACGGADADADADADVEDVPDDARMRTRTRTRMRMRMRMRMRAREQTASRARRPRTACPASACRPRWAECVRTTAA
jgi:hypothetical protein